MPVEVGEKVQEEGLGVQKPRRGPRSTQQAVPHPHEPESSPQVPARRCRVLWRRPLKTTGESFLRPGAE